MSTKSEAYLLQGHQGGVVLSGAGSAVGNFRWLKAVSDCVLLCDTGETAGNLDDIVNLDNVTLLAGDGIGGNFTKVQIGSGIMIAYKG